MRVMNGLTTVWAVMGLRFREAARSLSENDERVRSTIVIRGGVAPHGRKVSREVATVILTVQGLDRT